MEIKLRYNGITYPEIINQIEGFEMFITLIPEPTGDYFLAEMNSDGKFKILDSVAECEVEIETLEECNG